jgi:hypothetical protein
MDLVDANVLLYAVNTSAEHHEESRDWLDGAINAEGTVALPWVCLLAFLRLSSRPGLFPNPLSPAESMVRVRDWLAQPNVLAVNPGARHAELLDRMIAAVGSAGNLVTDAHLAALALEHRARLVTFDNDFDRFPDVRWTRPGEA